MKNRKQNLITNPLTYILTTIAIILGVTGGYFFRQIPEPIGDDWVMVERVIDGDTFDITGGERVRLIGVDSPEQGRCYYRESKEELKKLIEGKFVRLEKDIQDKGIYGRILRYAILEIEGEDNILINDWLVREGLAFDISDPPNHKYRDLLRGAGEVAKRGNVGLWKECEYLKSYDPQKKFSEPSDPNCTIKGNLSEKGYGKIYSVKGCPNYGNIKIDLSIGEMYFCTEQEAIDAGFKKSGECPQ